MGMTLQACQDEKLPRNFKKCFLIDSTVIFCFEVLSENVTFGNTQKYGVGGGKHMGARLLTLSRNTLLKNQKLNRHSQTKHTCWEGSRSCCCGSPWCGASTPLHTRAVGTLRASRHTFAHGIQHLLAELALRAELRLDGGEVFFRLGVEGRVLCGGTGMDDLFREKKSSLKLQQ